MSLIKVEIWVDGACSGNPGPAGVGVVLRANGSSTEAYEYIGLATNNVAEMRAAAKGILSLKCPDLCDVTLYSDSALVVNVLNGDWTPCRSRFFADMMIAAAAVCGDFRAVKVARKARKPDHVRADRLAKQAIRDGFAGAESRSWFSPMASREAQPEGTSTRLQPVTA